MSLTLRIVMIVALGCLSVVLPASPAWAEEKTVSNIGPSLLFDAFTGEVISQERAGEPWYPASLTKLMTGYVIFRKIRSGTLKLDQKIPVSALAHSQPASHTGLPTGTMVTVDLALQAMLVYSANDMAYVLAEGASGSVQNFAKDMNDVAREVGLTATHFENPNGLFDPRQITSARDIGIVAALIINQFPEHAHYFAQEAVLVGKRRLPNHNSLIRLMPEAVGMKTGFICNSGYNLVGSAVKNGRQLISVVLGALNGGQRAQLSMLLLQSGFDRPTYPAHGKVGDIIDQTYGAIVPADMTKVVCKKKDPVTPANAYNMTGWAVSFGTYGDDIKADMALRGRLISPIGIEAGGIGGVIKLPNKAGYSAMLWNLDMAKSLSLCNQYKQEGATCDVLPETMIRQMATAAAPDPNQNQPATDEGSDDDTKLLRPAVKGKVAAPTGKAVKPAP
ncbi:MAG: D-alanyl-D-alanine carboxypeptidase [Alphaproteobacteria bacterium]|nr:D-alanyl-D-alanine carboxypeptidase [Alphaproteobacteria bacterium]